MAIPKTRSELVEAVDAAYAKLFDTLDGAGDGVGELPGEAPWTVKDLLAVRVWWAEAVVGWISAGRAGESPETPAPGFKWTETPRLNQRVVDRARGLTYGEVRDRLGAAAAGVRAAIDGLDDRELLEPGVFAWAGKWPLARWISINSARQAETARAAVRRALRAG